MAVGTAEAEPVAVGCGRCARRDVQQLKRHAVLFRGSQQRIDIDGSVEPDQGELGPQRVVE